jgi:hypothetical protein
MLKSMKKQIETIDKIIQLLPDLIVYKDTKELKDSYAKLQQAIKTNELERIFNQPITEEESDSRRIISKEAERIRKSGKNINL